MLKYAILGFVSYRPMSGYDIGHWMSASTGHFWHAKLSQIYTTLKAMEAEKLVISEIEPQSERPDRRVYQITDTGKAALDEWRGEILTGPEMKKDSLLLKVFFAAPDDLESLLTQLRVQLQQHQKQQQIYETETPGVMLEFLGEQPELLPNAQFWELARQYGIQYEAGYITWLEAAINYVESRVSSGKG